MGASREPRRSPALGCAYRPCQPTCMAAVPRAPAWPLAGPVQARPAVLVWDRRRSAETSYSFMRRQQRPRRGHAAEK
jgi:hypothetical protein